MKFTGINHLAMATGDMDRTIRFWRDLLGMRLVAGLGEPGYRHYFFEISDLIDHGFIRSIYAHDPNGIPIEFSANVRGTDVRQHPVMGDKEPTAAAREGTDPQPGHWPPVTAPTPPGERRLYSGAGSELFHGKKR